MQIDKGKVSALADKLGALDCADGFDETILLYPETEAWDGVVGKLCDRLRCGCTVDTLVKEDTWGDTPSPSLKRTQHLLDALCIEATAEQIQGSGTMEDRTNFLQQLVDLVSMINTNDRGNSLRTAAHKDAQLLAAGCRASGDLASEDVNLFKRYPEIHSVIQATKERQEEEQPLRQKLEAAKEALGTSEATFDSLTSVEKEVDPEQLMAACAGLEHSIGAFVSGAAEFHAIYSRDIEPWTAAVAGPGVHGIGPLARDVDSKYSSFRQVLKACSVLRASYEELVRRHSCATEEKGFMPALVAQGPGLAKELQERADTLQILAHSGSAAGVLATKDL